MMFPFAVWWLLRFRLFMSIFNFLYIVLTTCGSSVISHTMHPAPSLWFVFCLSNFVWHRALLCHMYVSFRSLFILMLCKNTMTRGNCFTHVPMSYIDNLNFLTRYGCIRQHFQTRCSGLWRGLWPFVFFQLGGGVCALGAATYPRGSCGSRILACA